MKTRPPIITILGHVDHGKTSLLDYIRKSSVASKESGGITQAIGAYEIEHDKKIMTFIDTPGHEAFSAMRARGAEVADLAILVVAADDGVKPQTKEALEYIKKVDIPYIVAVNKIDLPGAELEKTLNDLATNEVYLEGRGGDVSFQPISATEGTGINELLDLVNLATEIQELTYDPSVPAEGIILNSFNDQNRGIVAGAVIKNGTLNKGDAIFTPTAEGKVKLLENFLGQKADSLEPSAPALILGFKDIPKVGEVFTVDSKPDGSSESKIQDESLKSKKDNHLGLIIKADEAGTLEALAGVVESCANEDVPITIVQRGVGNITEGDVKMAFSTDSVIVGFNIKADKETKNLAKTQKVDIITSTIIYDLEKKLREIVDQMSEGRNRVVHILGVFGKSKENQVVGGKVMKGYVLNKEYFKIFKDKEQIGKGKIINLQSQKDDVNRADEGSEVGMVVQSDVDIEKGCFLLFGSA